MKKMLIFGGIIIVLFAAIFAVTQMEKKNASTDEKGYYSNKISLEDLNKNIEDKKEQTIYFYQTSCVHCQKVSPIVVPLAKDLNVDMKVIDIENLNEPWDKYNIQGTPTIIHFKDGKEVSRISGEQSKDKFKEWFEQTKK
ncbi:TPA: thioredoxin family protein [Bacillus cereus]|jgi:thioredoxin-like negative regulator of GroEL|uniref:Thioredoxin n=10 Tax=Bacillus cereus group TaxID=86661 RepID=A0A0J1KV08_BACAN|nr:MULTISPECIES: thioredoxin family protein [Bacillus]EDX54772.1 putative thioredoxin [Bacillus cereus W]EDX70296.1 putative thioredoxin [Bacillus cereus NVH0597-99]MDR4322170.1 thioredoxin family protein [Bacillus paranthracis]OON44785.1 thiol reductase thioredoxin [Klebsiella pneumoniae]COD93514.1 thioredoxin [Streptococcus pneumoniae]CUB55411.1 Thioredoxin [Bacillus subtilis]HDR4493421.1 thioredoxin family protein [Bacillus cereus biovar anthracis]